MFIIGIDPHKGSHTAAVLDRTETVIGELRVSADRQQRDQLLCFAASFTPRTWAIESASGLGAPLAQQLVAAGELVLDVPPTLSARVRLLDSGCTDKTDPHDARAAAIVALRHTRLRQVTPVDHTAVLRLLADRHHDLTGLRTQAICRLHALLCDLTPGGAGRLLSAFQAGRILRGIRPMEPVEIERKRIALEPTGDVRRFRTRQNVSTDHRYQNVGPWRRGGCEHQRVICIAPSAYPRHATTAGDWAGRRLRLTMARSWHESLAHAPV